MRPFASLKGLQEADALAQRYGTTPAALLGETDPYRAYCINQACALAGQALEKAARAEADAPSDPLAHMMQLLGKNGRRHV